MKITSEPFLNTGTTNLNGLWANLVDANDMVVGSDNVDLNGLYALSTRTPGTYSIIITTSEQTEGGTLSASGIFPGWVHTGTNRSGTPDIGNRSGIIPGVTLSATDLNNQNFGVQRIPLGADQTDTPRVNPGGTGTANSSVINANVFTGIDDEDGPYPNNLAGRIVDLEPGNNGDVYYDGELVVSGDPEISNFDPGKVTVDPAGTSNQDMVDVTFTYTVADNAGFYSVPKTITVPFSTNPMPVTLVSFNCRKSDNNNVELNWATTAESNSEKFEVEHSLNGKDWTSIGSVAAKGESKVIARYDYVHNAPVSGDNLYRLKMVDTDASFGYSRVVGVNFEGSVSVISYPNPAVDKIRIKLEGVSTADVTRVKVYAQDGKLIYTAEGMLSGEIDATNLASGTYIMNITLKNGTTQNTKVVVVK